MVRLHANLILGLTALVGFMISGCEAPKAPEKPAAEHERDHEHGHDHGHEEHEHAHETYAAAMQEVTELNEKIRDAFAKDDMQAADEPLHELGHILSDEGGLVSLAEKAEITGDDLATIKTTVEQLMTDFAKVDDKIHNKGGVAYSEVEKQVTDGIATLQKYVPAEK